MTASAVIIRKDARHRLRYLVASHNVGILHVEDMLYGGYQHMLLLTSEDLRCHD